MRKEKALTTLLANLVELLEEEAGRNPTFAVRLEGLLTGLPEQIPVKRKAPKHPVAPMSDLHSELQARGEQEFRHWLREQPAEVLRASIRSLDLDPSRRTAKWKQAEKLADFIADTLQSRLARGAAFLGRGAGA